MDEAIALGRQAVELTEQHEVTWWQAAACAVLGDTLLLADDRAGAVEVFEQGLAAALAADSHALARLGQGEQARAELGRAVRLVGQHGLPHVLREIRQPLS